MKQIFITGKRKCEIRETPNPKAVKNWALVKITVAPMCTEYKQYVSGQVHEPLGHEAAGEVIDVAQPGRVKAGDRVVVMPQYPCGVCDLCLAGEYIHCQHTINIKTFTGEAYGNSTYAQYILKPDWLLPVIPDDISDEHASMLCCGLGPTFGALERMQTSSGDVVLITGLGPVGLGGVINARYKNCRVIGITGNPYRANLAIELGAEKIFNPLESDLEEQILAYTNGIGVDGAMECSGDRRAMALLLKVTRRNGKISFIGESGKFCFHVSDELIRNGLKFYGIWHYNLNGVAKLFELVRESGPLLDKLISHRFSYTRVEEAWELQATHACGKVILRM
jgi:L-iditol 2-dehydrogenase